MITDPSTRFYNEREERRAAKMLEAVTALNKTLTKIEKQLAHIGQCLESISVSVPQAVTCSFCADEEDEGYSMQEDGGA